MSFPISKYPILLLPLKLETRFVKIDNNNHQLWIRAFPDQVFLQSHNPLLNQEEKEDALRFKSLSNDGQKRSVWEEELVLKYGVYRASWIVQITEDELSQQEAPINGNDPSFKFNWLPDRLVFYLYKKGDPINSPSYTEDGPIIDRNGITALGPGDEWLQDFDLAIQAGMGIKINLRSQNNDNWEFERIIVSGFRFDNDPAVPANGLADLFNNHKYTEGFSFLEYGTPTNNSENVKSGHSIREEFEVGNSYEYAVEGIDLDGTSNVPVSDIQSQTTGKYLSKILGFEANKLKYTKNAGIAPEPLEELYQKATWFALGAQPLFMLFGDQISSETHETLWKHYSKYVKSKGVCQALKIGNQPYGILPIMNISHSDEIQNNTLFDKMTKIFAQLLQRWIQMVNDKDNQIPRLTGQDTQEEVLKILSMQEGSHTYQIRPLAYTGFKGKAYEILKKRPQDQSITQYLEGLGEDYLPVKENVESFANLIGLNPNELSQELDQILRSPFVSFTEREPGLITFQNGKTVLINSDGNISEQESNNQISFTQQDLGSFQDFILQIQEQEPGQLIQYRGELSLFTDLFIKSYTNALQLYHREVVFDFPFSKTVQGSFYTIGKIMKVQGASVSKGEPILEIHDKGIKVMDIIAPFDGVVLNHYFSEKNTKLEITPGTPLFVLANEEKRNEIKDVFITLGQQIIDSSNQIPEGEEREKAQAKAIGQVIDINSYRLDAWILSLAVQRLEGLRNDPNYEKGVYFGAYGLLENLKANKTIVEIGTLNDPDSKKGGIIHTPGTAQNIAASIFKNSYLAHKYEKDSNPFATNLTSDRIQKGGALLDGIRQDQQLEALLGYQLERHLHENDLHNEIYQLREVFPLHENTVGDNAGFVELSVIDGLKAIQNKNTLPQNVTNQGKVKQLIDELEDTLDASLDLLFYEAGYQVTQGNLSQAAAAIDATKGEIEPPVIESIKTRIPGTGLNHKLGIVFPRGNKTYTIQNPLALVEPSVEAWLENNLGDMDAIACNVEVQNPEDDIVIENVLVTLANLEIGYLDFLYMSEEPVSAGASELELRIQSYVKDTHSNLPENCRFVIKNTGLSEGASSFMEALVIVRYAKDVLAKARPMTSNDLTLEGEAIQYPTSVLDQVKGQRIAPVLDQLRALELVVDLNQKSSLSFLSKLDFESAKAAIGGNTNIDQEQLRDNIKEKIALVEATLAKYSPDSGFFNAFECLNQAAQLLFGKAFKLLPPASASVNFAQAITEDNQHLLVGDKTKNTTTQVWGQDRIHNWVQGVSQVYENAEAFEDWLAINNVWNTPATEYSFKVVQGPTLSQYPWIGLSKQEIDLLLEEEYSSSPIYLDPNSGKTYPINGNTYYPEGAESIVLYSPSNVAIDAPVYGLVINEFPEHVPNETVNTGLSFNYDTPNNEPPQALLLAIHPKAGKQGEFFWGEDDLRNVLYDTMDLYKVRMVDVEAIQEYGYILPMTYWFNVPSNK